MLEETIIPNSHNIKVPPETIDGILKDYIIYTNDNKYI